MGCVRARTLSSLAVVAQAKALHHTVIAFVPPSAEPRILSDLDIRDTPALVTLGSRSSASSCVLVVAATATATATTATARCCRGHCRCSCHRCLWFAIAYTLACIPWLVVAGPPSMWRCGTASPATLSSNGWMLSSRSAPEKWEEREEEHKEEQEEEQRDEEAAQAQHPASPSHHPVVVVVVVAQAVVASAAVAAATTVAAKATPSGDETTSERVHHFAIM
jgi:hypothetical protein